MQQKSGEDFLASEVSFPQKVKSAKDLVQCKFGPCNRHTRGSFSSTQAIRRMGWSKKKLDCHSADWLSHITLFKCQPILVIYLPIIVI